jgi:NADPH2:quinone reductase
MAAIKLLAQGRWKPLIGAKLPLAQASEGHRLVESRASTGKVLLIP